MVEYTAELALQALDSVFVDDAIFLEKVGGRKYELTAVRDYLALPIKARPDVSWFFDRQFYLDTHPDIVRAGVDPLIHFIKWGAAEGRNPHPLIDLTYMRATDQSLARDPTPVNLLVELLTNDVVDPSPYFSIDYYKSQLNKGRPSSGALLHYLQSGCLDGYLPNPFWNPLAHQAEKHSQDIDIRPYIREFVRQIKQQHDSSNRVSKKICLEGLVYNDPSNVQIRQEYFDHLLETSRSFLGCGFVSLPEVRAPIMYRAASSDLLSLINIFSYVHGDTANYAYGLYGFDIPIPRRILDIGAYCGYAAIYFANRFPSADIVCVEPPGPNADVLAANIAPYPNIRSLPVAIWPYRTRVKPAGHVSGDWGRIYQEITSGGEDDAEGSIPAYTVDDVLNLVGWRAVDFVKCQAENTIVDVLCSGERRWLNGISCLCAIKPAGRWPRPDDEALLQSSFSETLFAKTSEENGLQVFIRRSAQTSATAFRHEPIHLMPPMLQSHQLVLENISPDPSSFYRFDYFNLHVVPNRSGEAVATVKMRLLLDGHTRFRTTTVTSPIHSTSAIICIRIIDATTGAIAFEEVNEQPGARSVDWDVGFAATKGIHNVEIAIESVNPVAGDFWVRFLDPRVE